MCAISMDLALHTLFAQLLSSLSQVGKALRIVDWCLLDQDFGFLLLAHVDHCGAWSQESVAGSCLGSPKSSPGICMCWNNGSLLILVKIWGRSTLFLDLLSKKQTFISHKRMESTRHYDWERTMAKLCPEQEVLQRVLNSHGIFLEWGES